MASISSQYIIPALVPASHNADVGILWVECQIAGLDLGSENGYAVVMLHPGHPAVAYDVTPSGHNIVGLARFRHGIVVASYDGGDIKPQIHL